MTAAADATAEAPYGLKKDGTPRKRPAPTWANDPVKVAAANAKRRGPRQNGTTTTAPASAPPTQPTAPPALSTDEVDDMLSRHRREWDARIAELKPLVDEHTRLTAAFEALNAV